MAARIVLERLAGEPLEDLLGRGCDVAAHRLDRAREVVVGGQVAADELEDRLHVLADRREDELVAPDGMPAELALVRLDALGDEAPAPLARPQCSPRSRRSLSGSKAARSSGSSRTSFFIRHRASIESQLRSEAEFWRRPSSSSSTVPRVFSITARRSSVADSWAKLSIQWIFQWRSWMSMASSSRQAASARLIAVGGVEALFQEREVALHLRAQAVPPPVGEVAAVNRQHDVEIRAHRRREGRVARHPGAVAGAVLGPLDAQVRIGRDGRRVDVAVDVLGQPVDGERRPETAEHVVAAEPPAADVEEHRADRVRDVQVVVDPEEVLLDLGIPGRPGTSRRPGTGRGSPLSRPRRVLHRVPGCQHRALRVIDDR